MQAQNKPFVITLEEHYWDAELVASFPAATARGFPPSKSDCWISAKCGSRDGQGRHRPAGALARRPGSAEDAGRHRRTAGARDQRPAACRYPAHPKRFAGFATLPTADPKAAADELERTVTKLGFKGAMVHGLTGGRLFIDDKQFWPIFERAQALDVPIYVHPAFPHAAVIEAYYRDYASQYPEMLGPALGFTVETKTQAIRLVLSGLFEPIHASRSSSAISAKGCRSCSGASTRPCRAPAMPGSPSRIPSASTSTSPPAATSPTRRCSAR